ncbi:unannotated protein [freshwater metagenome]|uniref:Unannotated protein n=1 Tax=freshwater metagenome TaxID=449393 RepID=A0A6J7EEZ7_9ZZZZ
MGELPAGEGVRRKARVHECHRAREALVAQVGEEPGDLVRDQHSLVDAGARGEARCVEVLTRGQLDDAADHVELALECVAIGGRIPLRADEDLTDERTRAVRGLPDVCDVDGDVAPAEDVLTLCADRLFNEFDQRCALGLILREEAHPDAVASELRKLELADGPQELVGNLREDPRAVAGRDVGALGTAVLEVVERLQRANDDVVHRLVVELGDHRDAAGVVLIARVVQAFGRWQMCQRHDRCPRRSMSSGQRRNRAVYRAPVEADSR